MRLIYEDALIEDLKKWKGLNNKTIEAVLETINKQPTAYDTEKVVEELENLSNAEADYYFAKSNDVIDRECAIEIVRRGGAE